MFAAAVKHAKAEKLKYNKTHLQAPKKESRDIYHKAIEEFMIAGRKAQRRGELFDIDAEQKAAVAQTVAPTEKPARSRAVEKAGVKVQGKEKAKKQAVIKKKK